MTDGPQAPRCLFVSLFVCKTFKVLSSLLHFFCFQIRFMEVSLLLLNCRPGEVAIFGVCVCVCGSLLFSSSFLAFLLLHTRRKWPQKEVGCPSLRAFFFLVSFSLISTSVSAAK